MLPDLVGTRLGEFEVVRVLGRGGMGVVYEAVQTTLGRRVAVKVLAAGLGLTTLAVERFRREAAATARLHHTNIVPVYATGEDRGVHYYAMELIDGPSLDAVIRRLRDQAGTSTTSPPDDPTATHAYTPPDPLAGSSDRPSGSAADRFTRVAAMIADVADALHHAHQHGITHRDVKPSNLMLSSSGRLALTDFGLARMLEEPGVTVTGEFVGTPAYMSPEQITAGRIPVDHRTDVYSLGGTLYELLTLRPPFAAPGRDQLLAMVLQKEPAPPRSADPKIPRDLETVCLKCLEKDPDRRYRTAKDLADDLRRFVNRFAILARRTGPLGRLKKWAKRNPWLAGTAAALVVAAGVAGYLAYDSWRREEARVLADRQAREAQRDEKMRLAQQRVLQGDFPAAEQSINEAVDLGAPPEWANWRRGQIAYHRGELAKAVELLDRAVPKLPGNTAARALLASACVWAGEWDKFDQVRDALLNAQPMTTEDRLYLGLAYSYADPAEGLRLIDQAVNEHATLISVVIKAQVRADQAMHTSDPALAAEAIKDADAAKRVLPNNPAALCTSVWVRLVAAALSTPKERERVIAVAREDIESLSNFTDLPLAILVRVWFLDSVGQPDKAEEACATRLDHPLIAGLYAHHLYRRGEVAQARTFVAGKFSATPGDRVYREWFFVENRDRHPAILAELNAYTDTLPPWRRPMEYAPLMFLLGKKAEAVDAAHRDLAHLGQAPPLFQATFGNTAKYLAVADQESEDKLLRAAGSSRRLLTSAHTLIGLSRLADGDRPEARRHFAAAVACGCFYADSYDWSRTFLARMDALENWPDWIKEK